MRCPTLSELPPPPPGKTGWPWTEEATQLPETRPDGTPWPRISIVTPSYNQGQFIEETIRSILLQGYPDLEFFIMDGGSTDQSLSIIERYTTWIDKWESTSDGGQAAAINKALDCATGVWFHNVNSDDVLLPEALKAIGSSSLECDVFASDVLVFDSSHEWISPNKRLSARNLIETRPLQRHWHQPGVVLQTINLRAIGRYPLDMFLWDMYATILYLERFGNVHYSDVFTIQFRVHHTSQTSLSAPRENGDYVVMRKALLNSLRSSKLRHLARLEVGRSEIERLLLSENGTHLNSKTNIVKALRVAWATSVILVFDRVLLASIKKLLTASVISHKWPGVKSE